MRIDGKQLGMDQLDFSSRSKKVGNKGVSGQNSADKSSLVGTDAVEISGRARQTASLARTLKDMSDVREDRVAELKSRISEGTYNVSGQAIAEKIVSTALNDLF